MSLAIIGLGDLPGEGALDVNVCTGSYFADDVDALAEQATILLTAIYHAAAGSHVDDDRARRDALYLQQSLRSSPNRQARCDMIKQAHTLAAGYLSNPAVAAARRGLELASALVEGATKLVDSDAIESRDYVRIPAWQRREHIGWKLAALTVAVPFSAYVASRRELPAWARVLAGGIGVATAFADGLSLYRYLAKYKPGAA